MRYLHNFNCISWESKIYISSKHSGAESSFVLIIGELHAAVCFFFFGGGERQGADVATVAVATTTWCWQPTSPPGRRGVHCSWRDWGRRCSNFSYNTECTTWPLGVPCSWEDIHGGLGIPFLTSSYTFSGTRQTSEVELLFLVWSKKKTENTLDGICSMNYLMAYVLWIIWHDLYILCGMYTSMANV